MNEVYKFYELVFPHVIAALIVADKDGTKSSGQLVDEAHEITDLAAQKHWTLVKGRND